LLLLCLFLRRLFLLLGLRVSSLLRVVLLLLCFGLLLRILCCVWLVLIRIRRRNRHNSSKHNHQPRNKHNNLGTRNNSQRQIRRTNLPNQKPNINKHTEVEQEPYNIQTLNYTTEAHLEFTIETIQLSPFPQAEVRTAQINKTYNYSLTTTNIGDIAAQNWNVTLTTPQQCNVTNATYQDGNYNSTNNNITWALPDLAVRAATNLTFSMNCTVDTATKFVLIAQGRIDNRSQETFTNDTNIGCSGATCTSTTSYTFRKPDNARYEKLSQINFSIFYNWTGQNVTIGQGYVNITNDQGKAQRIWQNYSYQQQGTTTWSNHTIYVGEQQQYQHATRDITTSSYTTSTANPSSYCFGCVSAYV